MANSKQAIDKQFAGLVEAATAAADQEVDWSPNDAAAGSAHQTFEDDQSNDAQPGNAFASFHSGQYDPSLRGVGDDGRVEGQSRLNARKRKRGNGSTSVDGHVAEQAASQRGTNQINLARSSAGVHSAAALFRAPSSSSKKYTRPPMSKLFSSLQLLPEEFLHLQSAAKAYMLDEDYPERRDCVGQRGKSDSDMVKLKLWHCVQEFLDQKGNGERFFGAHAIKPAAEEGARTLSWPEDAQQIIKICIPLMRRMVTNERQRKYAVESRKGGGETKTEGHGQDKSRSKTSPPRATFAESDNAVTFTREKLDIFGDGLLPDPAEASEWFNVYNDGGVLDRIFIESGLPRVLFLPLITNIDGHCRFYHGNSGPHCTDSCKHRLVGRLLELTIYQASAPAVNPFETINEIFNVILTHLIRMDYWKNITNGDPAMSAPKNTMPARPASSANSSIPRKDTRSSDMAGDAQRHGRSFDSTLRLLVYLVHQDKCLLPFFDVPSSQCPNIEAFRRRIEEHYGLATLQTTGVTCLSEAILKVWLPDGLVRVEDDGQWIVALLSADSVEWMGGQIRVLLDVQ